MAELARSPGTQTNWGPAERAAIDRCLSIATFAARPAPPRPIRLSRVIEAEIIPRLMLAHRSEPRLADGQVAQPWTTDVAQLASLAIGADSGAALEHVNGLLDRGYPLVSVLLDALAPTARLLGDMWRDDLCSFTDVTIGLCRLQQVVRALGDDLDGDDRELTAADASGGRILLMPAPGEQHSFGVTILETFFRRAGWDVTTNQSAAEARDLVRTEWFDVVGLSLSSDVLFDRVRPAIQALRRSARNPSLFVMVGGRFFMDHPERAAEVGADTAASDAHDALRQAQSRSNLVLARC